MSNTHYYFLPSQRHGLAAAISGDATGKQRAEIDVVLTASARLKGQENRETATPQQTVQLFGPGDILGFDQRIVMRTDPVANAGDFEPNYFPAVEFADTDFAWRFTPSEAQPLPTSNNGAQDEHEVFKLMPWITLIVLVSETRGDDIQPEFREGTWPGGNLPRHIVVDTQYLPDLSHAWRWAHVHIAAEAGLALQKLKSILRNETQRGACRLLCPRRLRPGIAYSAFVVPTSKLGVLAGRGIAFDKTDDATQPAWNSGDGKIKLPYYYQWNFRTGMRGDFEHLVRLLEVRDLSDLGTRDINCDSPGYLIPGVSQPGLDPPHQHYLGLEGALQSIDTQYSAWGVDASGENDGTDLPDQGAVPEFQEALADLINDPPADESQDSPSTMPPLPWVVPPIYGRWHYGKFKDLPDNPSAVVDAHDQAAWIDQLNLDPRHRAAAGLGAEVVRKQQEGLMASAWEQLGAIESSNDILRRAQFGRDTSRALFRRMAQLPAEAFLQLTRAVQPRILVANPDEPEQKIPAAQYLRANSRIQEAALDPAFRHISRSRGPIRKRQQISGDENKGGLLSRLASGDLEAAGPPPKPLGTTRLCDITGLLRDPVLEEQEVPTLWFTADRLEIPPGESVELEWRATGVSACEASGGWSGTRDPIGKDMVTPNSASTTYTLSCQGPGGGAVQPVTIQILPPELTLKADPPAVTKGGNTTLRWSSLYADSCEVSGGGWSAHAQSGTETVGPIDKDTTYTLTCNGPGGSNSLSIIVQALEPAEPQILIFYADPPRVTKGGTTTLYWSTENAESCEVIGGIWRFDSTSGTEPVGPIETDTTFALACEGSGVVKTKQIKVFLETPKAPTLTFEAIPAAVPEGGCTTLTWSTDPPTPCQASGDWEGSKGSSGTKMLTGVTTSNKYSLKPRGFGDETEQTVTVQIQEPPKISMTVKWAGSTFVTVEWLTEGADTCVGSDGWNGTLRKKGSYQTRVRPSTHSIYTLTCQGPGGTAVYSIVILGTTQDVPTLSLTAAPASTPPGGCAILTWFTEHMDERRAGGAWSEIKNPAGKEVKEDLKSTSTFILTCIYGFQRLQKQVTVEVGSGGTDPPDPPPHLDPWADSQSYDSDVDLGSSQRFDALSRGSKSSIIVSAPFPLPLPFADSDALRFCDGFINCAQLTEALSNHDPFQNLDLPGVPDAQTMTDLVCATLDAWFDGGEDSERPPQLPPGFVQSFKEQILPELNPEQTILDRTKQRLRLSAALDRRFAEGARGDPLDLLMWSPHFPQPMYKPLRDISHELLLPGVEKVRENTIGLLNTNRRFLEAYLCGLNHEFAGELLWREYPTDQRGSYFRQFWDVSEYVIQKEEVNKEYADWLQLHNYNAIQDMPRRERESLLARGEDAVLPELQKLIAGHVLNLKTILDSAGVEQPDDLSEDQKQEYDSLLSLLLDLEVLLKKISSQQTGALNSIPDAALTALNDLVEQLMKEELMKEKLRDIEPLTVWGDHPLSSNRNRSDEDVVLLIRGDLLKRYPNALIFAVDADDSPGNSAPGAESQSRIFPTFRATLPPDMTFFGFPFAPSCALGKDGSAGKYFVIEERVSEPRFGLDATTAVAPELDSWDNLSWTHFGFGIDAGNEQYGAYLDTLPEATEPLPANNQNRKWLGSSSAARAWMTMQKPVRIAIHARQMIPLETGTG